MNVIWDKFILIALREGIRSNNSIDNFMLLVKGMRQKGLGDKFEKLPNQIIDNEKTMSKTLYKNLIVESCQGDFCDYIMLEKNK